jgi:hypothetical protein
VLVEALERVSGAPFVHVSVDLDVVDPDVAPGVGSPVRGGFSYREAHLMMELAILLAKWQEDFDVKPVIGGAIAGPAALLVTWFLVQLLAAPARLHRNQKLSLAVADTRIGELASSREAQEERIAELEAALAYPTDLFAEQRATLATFVRALDELLRREPRSDYDVEQLDRALNNVYGQAMRWTEDNLSKRETLFLRRRDPAQEAIPVPHAFSEGHSRLIRLFESFRANIEEVASNLPTGGRSS